MPIGDAYFKISRFDEWSREFTHIIDQFFFDSTQMDAYQSDIGLNIDFADNYHTIYRVPEEGINYSMVYDTSTGTPSNTTKMLLGGGTEGTVRDISTTTDRAGRTYVLWEEQVGDDWTVYLSVGTIPD